MKETTEPLDSDRLYERYGKPLERKHHGEYIAISRDGQVILDADDLTVVDQAIQTFGSGNFVFRRIGYSYVWKLRWEHEGIIKRLQVIFDHGNQIVVEP